jgi:phosphomannomutase
MIKFGTDGWRGLIARDFTFANIRLAALATAKYIKKTRKKPKVVIGYDTRFLSKMFADETAAVLAWQGVIVNITDNISSTPQVSYHTKQKRCDLGIVITASHNPAEYNGFKVKARFGGPATPEQIALIEKELKVVLNHPPKFTMKPIDTYINLKKIRFFDAQESYLRNIKKKIDVNVINKADFKILYDPMFGAGINTMKKLLPKVEEIHDYYNPSFGNIDHPEPIKECLGEAIAIMKKGNYDVCLATDGDADRLGVIDKKGNYVDPHRVFMILLKYLYEHKKKRGAVAKTVSLTSMVSQYCEKHSIPLHETPVGFKHIAKLMNEEKILIGGEESGGLGTILHIPERDGIFNAMLLIEVMAKRNMSLKELSDELDEEFGIHRFLRRDVRVTEQMKKEILAACKKKPKKLGRFTVRKLDTKDGFKFYVDDGWLLIRASGTEPLLRFYAESNTIRKVNELIDEALKIHKKKKK